MFTILVAGRRSSTEEIEICSTAKVRKRKVLNVEEEEDLAELKNLELSGTGNLKNDNFVLFSSLVALVTTFMFK